MKYLLRYVRNNNIIQNNQPNKLNNNPTNQLKDILRETRDNNNWL